MWIFNKHGFYSVVQTKHDEHQLMVRGRKLPQLQALARLVDKQRAVIATRDSDYPYRFVLSRTELAGLMVRMANEIDYTNYKEHMAKGHPAGFIRVLHDVWALLADWQQGRHK